MAEFTDIQPHMKVVGADGVPVGTVDHIDGGRIKLTRDSSGDGHHHGHHHYIEGNMVADIEGDTVRLSANADVAVLYEEEEDGSELK